MNILIIPEDFSKDQYILKPIIEAMFKSLDKSKSTVKVKVCQDPRLGDYVEALKWNRIEEVINQYKWYIDLFILCVDRDGNEARKNILDNLEKQAAEILVNDKLFLAENAWQEVEVWLLAGHQLPTEWSWSEIRQEIDPKEKYFVPFATQRNLLTSPAEGRRFLAEEAAKQYQRIRKFCPEDIRNLETRINRWLNQ